MAVPYTFATATSSIPLSQLDANFATGITLGNTTVYLGNTTTSIGNLTLTNATISSVASTFPNSYLANSSVTIGSTNVSLGGTATTIAGLTLTSPTITGGTSTATQNLANVTGTLAVGNGGTGLTSLTAGYIPYGNGTSALSTSSNLQFDGNNLGIGGTKSYSGYRTLLVQGTNISNGGVIQIQNSDSSVQSYWLNTSALVNFGSITSTPVGFITGNTERMRIDSSGNVGIGTSSPSALLEVAGAAPTIKIFANNATQATLQLTQNGVGNWLKYFRVSDSALVEQFGGTDLLFLSTSGNLGLGVTPSAWSAIKPLEFINGVFVASYNVANVANAYFGCNTYYNGTNWIYKTTDYASYYQQSGGKHLWYNAPSSTSGATATFTQAMTLDNSGNLLVGTTSTSATSGLGLKFINNATNPYVAHVITDNTNNTTTYELYSTAASAFRFFVGGGGTIYATSIVITAISDQRLKENIRDLDTGLSTVMALKPRRFDWKEGKGQDKKNAAGFIAQEFQEVLPNSVSTYKAGGDGIEYLTMNHEELIPTLVKAIQELKAEVDSLKQQLNGA